MFAGTAPGQRRGTRHSFTPRYIQPMLLPHSHSGLTLVCGFLRLLSLLLRLSCISNLI